MRLFSPPPRWRRGGRRRRPVAEVFANWRRRPRDSFAVSGRLWAPFYLGGPVLVLLGVTRIAHQPHHAAAWILGALQCVTGLLLLTGFGVYLRKPAIRQRYDWRGRDRFKLERDQRKRG
jgi:hypothetical protein